MTFNILSNCLGLMKSVNPKSSRGLCPLEVSLAGWKLCPCLTPAQGPKKIQAGPLSPHTWLKTFICIRCTGTDGLAMCCSAHHVCPQKNVVAVALTRCRYVPRSRAHVCPKKMWTGAGKQPFKKIGVAGVVARYVAQLRARCLPPHNQSW